MTPTITTTTGDALSHTLDAAKRVILSVGSGDGSQQASIVRAGHSNMVSTFYDTETAAYSKYGRTAKEHITFLERSSTAVLFQVDATKLHEHPHLQGTKFDIILFTFPHTGVSNFERLCRGPSPTSIKGNKRLIRDFLKSAQRVLKLDGEILVTLKTTAPYDQWSFPDFADYEVEPVSTHNFDANLFPGYVHRSTEKRKSIGTVVKNGAAKMYVFGSKKRKHQALRTKTPTQRQGTSTPNIPSSFPFNWFQYVTRISRTLLLTSFQNLTTILLPRSSMYWISVVSSQRPSALILDN